MLLRPDGDDVLCIGQASHAWISGQIARAWAEPFEPHEEVCLAAEQHDVGMAEWDLSPSLNPETGLPHAFTEMPFEVHSALWLEAPRKLVTTSAYAAALVSLHGTRLYELREPTAAIEEYLGRQEEFRRALGFAREDLEPGSTLVWIWDYLSLAFILGWEGEVEGLAVSGLDVSPWPFGETSVTFRCEARRLRGRFSDEGEMRQALAAAPVEPFLLELAV
ncbi:MAG: DUF3891 family protein [Actinomycetota bacterium]|nr:DUF3891 family protein [Actinomycetota bacterium]